MNDDERRVLPATSGRAVQVWLTVVCAIAMLTAPSACVVRHGSPASTVPPEPSRTALPVIAPTKTAASPTGTPAPSAAVETVTLRDVGEVRALAYSPDGSRLAIARRRGIHVFDAATLRQLYHLYDAYARSLAFSADGAVLAAALYDGTIGLWEGTEGHPLRSLSDSTSTYPTLVAFSPDGSTLAADTEDDKVRLWRLADGQLLRVLDPGGSIYGLAFSPDGATLSVEAGGGLRQWRVADGQLVRTIAEGAEMPPPAAFSPEGTVEARAVGDTVFVWDLMGNRLAATFPGEDLRALAVSNEGRLVATASDRVLHLWRVGDGRPLCAVRTPQGAASALALAPDGSALALASRTEVRLWRIAEGRLVSLDLPGPMPLAPAVPEGGPLPAPPGISITAGNVAQLQEVARWGKGAIRQLAYSPDGRQLAVASTLGVRLYDTATYSETAVLEDGVPVSSVAFSPDGALLAATAGQEVHLWRLADRRLLRTLASQTDAVLEVAFSPDGSTLASRSYDGVLRLWRVADGELVREVEAQGWISSFAFSPDGKLLVASDGYDTILLLRAADGGLVRELDAAEYHSYKVAFSPDGAYVAGVGALGLGLWRVSDGTLVHGRERWVEAWAVAFSPDGEFLAQGRQRGGVDIVRAADGAHLRSLAVAGPAIEVAISPAGAALAAGSLYGTVSFWSLPEGRLLHQLEGWQVAGACQGMGCLAISPDGALVATGSHAGDTGSVILWQVADGRALHRFDAEGHEVGAVAFSPDGSLLAAANDYGSGFVWDVPEGTLNRYLSLPTRDAKLAFSPDGTVVWAGGQAESIYSWRVADGEELGSQDCGLLHSFALSPDGSALATVDYYNTLRLWRSPGSASPAPAGPMPAWTWAGEPGTVPGEPVSLANAGRVREVARWGRGTLYGRILTYSPDGRLLATGCPSGVYLFAADILGEPRLLDLGAPADRVIFSPDGTLIAASSAGGIHFWRTADLQPVHTISRPGLGLEGFLPDGTAMLAREDGVIRVYRVPGEPSAPAAPARPTPAAVASAPIRPDDMGRLVPVSRWDGSYVTDVAYSADGRLLAIASTAGLALYDASSLEAVRVLPGGDYDQLAFAAWGDVLLARSTRSSRTTFWDSATVWQVDSGRVIGEFPAPDGTDASYALSPAGDLVAAAQWGEGIRLWRMADCQLLYSQPAAGDYAALAFSADGTLLATWLEDGTIRLIRVPEGTVVREIVADQDSTGSLCFSPDGALLASWTSNSALHLWRVADGCLLNSPDEIYDHTYGAGFSPDGALLAWAADGKVCVGRASDGQVLYTLDEASVWGGSIFSPDGRVLVTRGEGIRLWDAADGRLLATLSGHQGRISGAVLSPDGRSLASWSGGVVRLWAVR